jgi:hypothetical protein
MATKRQIRLLETCHQIGFARSERALFHNITMPIFIGGLLSIQVLLVWYLEVMLPHLLNLHVLFILRVLYLI